MCRLNLSHHVRNLYLLVAVVATCLLTLPEAQAGLTIQLQLYHNGSFYYLAFPNLSTNGASANPADTGYSVWTHGSSPNSGIHGELDAANNSGSGSGVYSDYESIIQEVTNLWTLQVTNASGTNLYTFAFSTFGSNSFPAIAVTFPVDGAVDVTNQPTFSWEGPSDYGELYVQVNNSDYSYYQSAYLPLTDTSWTSPFPLHYGTNYSFSVVYNSNADTVIIASVPTNSLASAFPGWVSQCRLQTYVGPSFTTVNPFIGVAGSGTGHTNLAHYTFDDNTVFTADVSGNNNNISSASGSGGDGVPTNDAVAGPYALQLVYDRSSGASWISPPDSIASVLSGSFSVALWLKTTEDFGNADDSADQGEGIFAGDFGGDAQDVVPMAMTGGKLAFLTDGGAPNTLHSAASINTGEYVHLVVTRNLLTGEKKIYVNAVLDASDTAVAGLLTAPNNLSIGANASNLKGLNGILDDVQIYSGVLSVSEIAVLFQNPGGAAPDDASGVLPTLGEALNAPSLTWTTGGDAPWFVQTTNTHDNVAAARSGVIDDGQQSWVQTTVTGPGTLKFWWKVSSEEGYDFLEFDLDGDYQDAISGDQDWFQETYDIPSGSHTLFWSYAKDDSNSVDSDAGFLDQVEFIPIINVAPAITRNPFDQTNYPGYSVSLIADATGSPVPTWQWFKVGSPSPIPDATNALFIPTNVGTAAVAGSYYAVASNAGGSANSSTALVSFVSAALPPDWTRAFKSPGFNNNTLTEEYYIACLPDASGNLYVAGSFTGSNTFGATTFTSGANRYETELVKQTPTGSLIWATAMTNNGAGGSNPQCVARAPGDGIYVAGNFTGTNWLGTNLLSEAGGGGYFLARFDANGNALWVRTVTSASNFVFTGFNCLVADAAGNVTVSGLIWGSATFASSDSATSTNIFSPGQLGALSQYDANGTLRWAEMPGAWVLNLAYSAGRIYGTMFTPATNFTGITVTTDRRYTLAAIDPANGHAIWLRGLGAPQEAGNPFGIVNDIPLLSVFGSNIMVVGTAFGSNAAFGPYSVSWDAAAGNYFARYDTNGNPQLATSFGSPTTVTFENLSDGSGNIYVACDFDTFTFFGNDLLAAPHLDAIGNGYYSAALVAKFDRDGNPLWARPAVSQLNYVNFRTLALAPDGVWACALIKSPTAFGSNTVFSSITCIGSPLCTLQYHFSGALAKITDHAAVPLPVTLINAQSSGAGFQFSFQSQAATAYTVLSRTNLALGVWQTNGTISGDGTLKLFTIPKTNAQQFFRVQAN